MTLEAPIPAHIQNEIVSAMARALVAAWRRNRTTENEPVHRRNDAQAQQADRASWPHGAGCIHPATENETEHGDPI
jgi:hypothetical protein